MNELTRIIIVTAAIVGVGSALDAQGGRGAGGLGRGGSQSLIDVFVNVPQADRDAQSAVVGPTVTGAPYSARGTTTFLSTLSDGTHITRTTSYTIARDGQGRLRREMPDSIWISDPVAHVSYVLSPADNTAQELPMAALGRRGMAAGGQGAAGGRGGRGMGTRGATGDAGQQPGMRAGGRGASGSSAPAGRGDAAGDQTLVAARGGRGQYAARGAGPGASLGKKTIDGLECVGSLVVSTIPTDAIGNDKPIDVSYERWYSEELQIVVLSRTEDPRTGDTTFRMTDIKRAEPDHAQFVVPANYRIVSR